MDKEAPSTLSATVNWLEVEQRQSKTFAAKLQQQVDQVLVMVNDVMLRLNKVEDWGEDLKLQVESLPSMAENIRQIREQVGQLQMDLSDNLRDREKAERLWRTEGELARQNYNALSQKVDGAAGSIESMDGKLKVFETVIKRPIERLEQLQGQMDDLSKQSDTLANIVRLHTENLQRIEGDTARAIRDLEDLRQHSEKTFDKTAIIGHQIQRIEERLLPLEKEIQVRQEMMERLEALKVRMERTEEHVVVANQTQEKQDQLLAILSKSVQDMEDKTRAALNHLVTLERGIIEHRRGILSHLALWGKVMEQHQWRQMDELKSYNREIKEYMARLEGAKEED